MAEVVTINVCANVATAVIIDHQFSVGDLICTRGLYRDIDPEWPAEIIAATPTTIAFPYTACDGPIDLLAEVILVEAVWHKMLEELERKRREIRRKLDGIERERPDLMVEAAAEWVARGVTLLDYIEEKACGLDLLRALVGELEERGDLPAGHVLFLPSSGTVIEVDDLHVERDFSIIDRVDGDAFGFAPGDMVDTGRGTFTARIDPNEHLDLARLVDASFRASRTITIRDRRSPLMAFLVQLTEAQLVGMGETLSFEMRGVVVRWPEQLGGRGRITNLRMYVEPEATFGDRREFIPVNPHENAVVYAPRQPEPAAEGQLIQVNLNGPIGDVRATARAIGQQLATMLRSANEQTAQERRLAESIDRWSRRRR